MPETTFGAKEFIFREGDPSDNAYVLQSGRVEILKSADHGEIQLAVLEAGATFGEMGLLDGSPRSATARTLDDETVVDIIPYEEFHQLMGQCSDRIRPIIESVFDRLRATTQRVSTTEQASIVLNTDINTIRIEADCEKLNEVFQPMEVGAARLPFRVGGYAVNGEPNRFDHNHLYLPCDGPPLTISRNHFAIEVEDDAIMLVDRGSRFNTVVNGKVIGQGHGLYKQGLKEGENEIILGGPDSEYKLKVTCIK